MSVGIEQASYVGVRTAGSFRVAATRPAAMGKLAAAFGREDAEVKIGFGGA